MPWTYHQATGLLNRPDGTLAAVGYSGPFIQIREF